MMAHEENGEAWHNDGSSITCSWQRQCTAWARHIHMIVSCVSNWDMYILTVFNLALCFPYHGLLNSYFYLVVILCINRREMLKKLLSTGQCLLWSKGLAGRGASGSPNIDQNSSSITVRSWSHLRLREENSSAYLEPHDKRQWRPVSGEDKKLLWAGWDSTPSCDCLSHCINDRGSEMEQQLGNMTCA